MTDASQRWPIDRKWLALAALALAFMLALAWRLPELVVSDADEGTYVYAGKLFVEGRLPYRDFLFAHPPGIMVLAAGAWALSDGSLFGVRLLFAAFWLLALVPITLLTERFTRSFTTGLVAAGLSVVGLLLVANMGRTARLEPAMLVFILWGFWAWIAAPRSHLVQAAAGAAFALATIVKLTSVVPIGAFVAVHLLLTFREPRRLVSALAGAAVIGVPVLLLCLRDPAFQEWVLSAQVKRPRDTMDWRVTALALACVRNPVLPLGMLAAAYQLIRGRNPHLKALAVTLFVTTFSLAFVFRSVAQYYFALPVPFAAISFAVALHAFVEQRFPRLLARGSLALVIATPLVALAFAEVYHRKADSHVGEPARIMPLLEGRQGNVWTMVPDFALFAERPLVDWYFIVDSYLARKIGALKDDELRRSLSSADSVVLYPGEFDGMPATKSTLERDFTLAHAGPAWYVWLRREPSVPRLEAK